MAGIQDGDLIYLRAVVGAPYEYVLGDTGSGTVLLNNVIGAPDSQWLVRQWPDRGWTLECQHDEGERRYLDIDADGAISLDSDPNDASTHWDFVPTLTGGVWQVFSRAHRMFLRGGDRFPIGVADGDAVGAQWELLIVAQGIASGSGPVSR
jgi:hypothetical protein